MFNIKSGEELTKLYLKSDVILLADVFGKFFKVSTEVYGIITLYCVSPPGYTYQCALKNTDIEIQTLRDKALILLIENKIRGGISSVMGDRYVKLDENKKILYVDSTNLYGQLMSQMLPYDEVTLEKDICLEELLNTPDDNEFGSFLKVDLKYSDNIKEKTKNFPFCPEKKKVNPDKYNDYMKKIKPKSYSKSKKLICDWTDKKKYLILYRIIKVYVWHGMVNVKIHVVISFKQGKRSEKYISSKTQKRKKA